MEGPVASRLVKGSLIGLNCLFLVFACGLLAISLHILLEKDAELKLLEKLKDAATDDSNRVLGVATSTMMSAAYLLLSFTVIIIVAFFACYGVCTESRIFLFGYTCFLFVALLSQSVALAMVLVYREQVLSEDAMHTVFEKAQTHTVLRTMWQAMERGFQCCGVSDETDYYTGKELASGEPLVPVSCCKHGNSGTATNEMTCREAHPFLNPNHDQGCYQAIKQFVGKWSPVILITAVFIIILEVITISLAIKMSRQVEKKRKYWQKFII